ncbi:fanconi-associated nuclease 1-like [Tribolium madens]|uniref:fanconi-associated nuclease 1-like n=1 Tax=Tribolium madens TaxID=41895 RepID=UPI001CF733B3|nr:fanconi-associated nuclease 1-like [Tribolium madens]
MSEFSPEKRLSQTKISSYFTGCVKRIPTDSPFKRKRFRRTMSGTSRDFSTESVSNTPSKAHSTFAGISKRKLKVAINSDDEDDIESDQRQSLSKENNGTPAVTVTVTVPLSLNKPTSVAYSSQNIGTSTPLNSSTRHVLTPPSQNLSTASTSPIKNVSPKQTPKKRLFNENSTANTPSTSKICVIENKVIVSSVKNTPKPGVKDESKKVNYEILKVMREFFINVLKYNHLRCLLSQSDQNMLYNFYNMEKDYQYTCVKLFLWKPLWYNIFTYVDQIGLNMNEKNVYVMYEHLKEKGFVDTDYMAEDTVTLLSLLRLQDLRYILTQFRLPTPGPKDVLIAKLVKNCKTQVTLTCAKTTEDVLRERIKERMGYCIKLSTNLNRCLRYVFLLNTFTNSSLTVPQDYFKNVTYFNTVFPSCKVETFHIFYTPQDFSKYANAVDLNRELEEAIEKKNNPNILVLCQRAFNLLKQANEDDNNSIREPHLERFTPNAQYIRIITKGLKHLKRSNFQDVKIWLEYLISQQFCKHKRGDWYCELSLIYTEYFKDYEKAAKLIIKAFKEEKEFLTDIQLQELAHRGKLTNRKSYNLPPLYHDEIAALSPRSCDRDWPQKVLYCKSLKSQESGQKRKYVYRCANGDVEYLTVEQMALKHYETMGFPSGLHCEGSLMIGAFCLLFWDIIYEKYVRGTFVSNLQNAPLDMYSPYFYKNRERWIQKRLDEIRDKWKNIELRTKLNQAWDLHSHESSLMQAEVSKPVYIFDVIMCIGRPVVAKIFERLAKNFKIYHSGFPDLIVWNVDEGKAKFVEVKGENDKLSIKQKLWLNYLCDIGASVEVCRVEPKATKKQYKRSVSAVSK